MTREQQKDEYNYQIWSLARSIVNCRWWNVIQILAYKQTMKRLLLEKKQFDESLWEIKQ